MSTVALPNLLPVIGWDATDDEWRAARAGGLGASDVAAALGFSRYRTPFQVWAEKTGAYPVDDRPSEASELGNDLEPWLLQKAGARLRCSVGRTAYRMYAHPQHPWRMASPDGTAGPDLLECKTAGLAGGFGIPEGWTEDTVPLGYELQARWQMHVLDRNRCWIVALVANFGFRMYPIDRDLGLELDLVDQINGWWNHHVVDGNQPALGGRDADAVRDMFPVPDGSTVDLDDTDAPRLLATYRTARAAEADAKATKAEAGTAIKALLGDATFGQLDAAQVVTWKAQQGDVDWQRMARDLAEQTHLELPDPDTYRRPNKRVLNVKELF